MHVSGNGIEVDFDGQTLTITPTDRVAAAALGGKRDVPLVLRRADIVKVAFRRASAMFNGKLVLTARNGAKYPLFFRMTSSSEFETLRAKLST